MIWQRKNLQKNKNRLPELLKRWGIRYVLQYYKCWPARRAVITAICQRYYLLLKALFRNI